MPAVIAESSINKRLTRRRVQFIATAQGHPGESAAVTSRRHWNGCTHRAG